ncbi:MAG: LexA family transcriptional repressor [Arcobacter sp.]|nr:MAG: LexA family transcriptional repressor [Arcobacter sp.]
MENYNEIIDKLKNIVSEELGDKKVFDKDVAEALGINYPTFRKQKQNNKIPYYEIMSFLAKRNISINWFFFNQLPESLIEPTSNYIILKYQKGVLASTGAGAINHNLNTTNLIIDQQLLDHIEANYTYTEVIKNIGDSMEPDIPNDSLIFIDKNDKTIIDKKIYLINSREGLYIKRILIKDKEYYMNSTNLLYANIKLSDEEIVGRVKGMLIKL